MLSALLLTENMLSGGLGNARINARAFQWRLAPIPLVIQNGGHQYILFKPKKEKRKKGGWITA